MKASLIKRYLGIAVMLVVIVPFAFTVKCQDLAKNSSKEDKAKPVLPVSFDLNAAEGKALDGFLERAKKVEDKFKEADTTLLGGEPKLGGEQRTNALLMQQILDNNVKDWLDAAKKRNDCADCTLDIQGRKLVKPATK